METMRKSSSVHIEPLQSTSRRGINKNPGNEEADCLPGDSIPAQMCILLFKSPLPCVKKIASLDLNKKDKNQTDYLKVEELFQVLKANPKSFIAFYNLNKVTTSLQVVSNTIATLSSSEIEIKRRFLDAVFDFGKKIEKLTKYLTLIVVNSMRKDTLISETIRIVEPNEYLNNCVPHVDGKIEDLAESSVDETLFKLVDELVKKSERFSNTENRKEKQNTMQEIIEKLAKKFNITKEELHKMLETKTEIDEEKMKIADFRKVADKNEIKKSAMDKESEMLYVRIHESKAENLKNPALTHLLRVLTNEENWPMSSVYKASRKAVPPFARRPLFSIKESKGLLSEDFGIQFSNHEVMLGFLTTVLKEIHPKKIHNRSKEIPKRVHMPEGENFQHLSLFDICGVSPLLTHVITCPTFQEVDGMMENMMNRLASFKDWPRNAPVSALRLVDSGFYLDLQASAVACYSCKLHIQTEELADELNDNSVLNMHLRLSENCPHALKQKHDKDQTLTESFRFSLSKERNTVGTDFFSSFSSSRIQKDNLNPLPELGRLEINKTENSLSILHLNSNYVEANKTLEKDNILSTNFNSQTYSKADSGYGSQTSSVKESHLEAKQCFPIQTEVPDSLNFINENTLHPNSLFGDHNSIISNEKHTLSNQRIIVAETSEHESSSILKSTEEDLAYSIRYPEYKTVDSRLKTFDSWPLNEKQDKKDLVICGFFYTGQQDIVRCFSCDIGLAEWDETDEPWSEHARHSPHCKYLKKFKGQDFVNRVQQEWRKIYNPKAPHMQDLAKRVESFRGGQWPDSHTQNPKQIAEAGFYYTGEEDAVRCHYCDGGLREWEPGDDPWTEHAHWFPFCKYLMKIKGVQFIDEVQQRYMSEQGASNESSSPQGGAAQSKPSEGDNNPLCSPAAVAVLDMGYTKAQVQYVIDKFVAEKGHNEFETSDLLSILLDMDDKGETIPAEAMTRSAFNQIPKSPSSSREVTDDSETDSDPERIEEENQRLKKQLLCIKCEKAERVIVFVPCGHRVVCKACSDKMRKCIQCKKKIQKKVKTYLC